MLRTFFRKNIAFILLSLLSLMAVNGQKPYIHFEHYSNENGLLSNFVEDIVQDQDGFLWFATDKGICRYDGSRYIAYTSDEDYIGGQPKERLYRLFVDNKNTLWTGSIPSGLSRYDREKDIFVNFKVNDNTGKANRIYDVFQDSKGRIWVGTGAGVFRFNVEKDSLFQIHALNRVLKLNEWNGELWASVDTKGIHVFDLETDSLKRILLHDSEDLNSLPGNSVFDLKYDRDSNLWVASDNCGFAKYNSTKDIFERLLVTIDGKSLKGAFTDILFAVNGTTYLAGDNMGLVSLPNNNPKAFQYVSEINIPNGLKANTVTGIVEDHNHSIWLSTYAGGLFSFSTLSQTIVQYKAGQLDGANLSHPFVSSFVEDEDGNVWVGLDGGGVNVLNRKTNKLSYFNEADNNLKLKSVVDLKVDRHGKIWLANWRSGYGSFNKEGGKYKFTLVNYKQKDARYYDHHKSILVDSKDRIWTANHFFAPSIYHQNESQLFTLENPGDYPVDLFKTERTVSYFEDSGSNIWVLTYSGLFRYNSANNTFYSYRSHYKQSDFKASEKMLDICEDINKNIWVSSNSSVLKYNKQSDRFTDYTEKIGLPAARSMISSGKYLWLTTNKGIVKFNIQTEAFEIFDDGYSMLGNTFSERAAFQASDGIIYFGGKDGFIMFHPDSIHINPYPPRVYITDIEVDGELQKPLNNQSVLKKQAYLSKQITLKPDQHLLTLHFSALNFIYSEKNHYEVMLEGMDKNWRAIQGDPVVTYTNLRAGKYNFKVKATNNDGVWSENEATLRIIVLPPYNRTWWFRGIMILLVVFFAFIFYKYKVNSITKRREWLEQEVNQRTLELNKQKEEAEVQRDLILWQKTELENHRNNLEAIVNERTQDLEEAKHRAEESDKLKTAFLQNLSHEIRTPLNAIIGFVEILDDPDIDIKDVSESKKIITRSSNTLLNIIEDIIQASLIESGQLQIKPSKTEVVSILKNLEEEFTTYVELEYKPITVCLDSTVKKLEVFLDKNLFERAMHHLLQNAVKFTPQGDIHFGVEVSDTNATFYVTDSGCGIAKKDIEHIFNRFRKFDAKSTEFLPGTGLGLSFSKWFVESHNGAIWVDSEPQVGSTFYISLPIKNPENTKQEASKIIDVSEKKPTENIPPLKLTGKTILIAEDDESNFIYISAILKKTGAKLIRAKNGLEAVMHFKDNKIDIVLMDLKMPEMDGVKAQIEIKKLSASIPIIAQTAFVHHEKPDTLLEQGFDAFIYKPIDRFSLLNLIEKHLL